MYVLYVFGKVRGKFTDGRELQKAINKLSIEEGMSAHYRWEE